MSSKGNDRGSFKSTGGGRSRLASYQAARNDGEAQS